MKFEVLLLAGCWVEFQEHLLEDSLLEDPLLLGCFQDLLVLQEGSFLEGLQEGSCLEGHRRGSFQVALPVLQEGSYPGGEDRLEGSCLENHSVDSWRMDLLEDNCQVGGLQKGNFQEEGRLKGSYQVAWKEGGILHIRLLDIPGCTVVGGSPPDIVLLEGTRRGIQAADTHGGSQFGEDSLLQEDLQRGGSFLQGCLGSLQLEKPQQKGRRALQRVQGGEVEERECHW